MRSTMTLWARQEIEGKIAISTGVVPPLPATVSKNPARRELEENVVFFISLVQLSY